MSFTLARRPSQLRRRYQTSEPICCKDYSDQVSLCYVIILTPHARTPPFFTKSQIHQPGGSVGSLVVSARQPVMGSVSIKIRRQLSHVENTSQGSPFFVV